MSLNNWRLLFVILIQMDFLFQLVKSLPEVASEEDSDEEIEVLFQNEFKANETQYTSTQNIFHTNETKSTTPRDNLIVNITQRLNEKRDIKNTTSQFRKFFENIESRSKQEQLYCYNCYTALQNLRNLDHNCFIGNDLEVEQCNMVENRTTYCYTEVNYGYIRRGCALRLPDLNFYCNCNLCNDRRSDRAFFFIYPKLYDMEYDNLLLNSRQHSPTLECKKCETVRLPDNATEAELQLNEECVDGSSVPDTKCEIDQVCATYIKSSGSYIYTRRGCADKPLYNSYIDPCLTSNCNNKTYFFQRPVIGRQEKRAQEKIEYIIINAVKRNSDSDFFLICIIMKIYIFIS